MGNYTVYMHVTPNNKKYIGITCKSTAHRWANGNGYKKNVLFYRAITKYGWDNIQHIIIAKDLSKEEACSLEVELIKKYNTTDPTYGYNVSTGGESGTNGVKYGPEFGQKVRDRMIGEKNMNYGKKFSEETRRKLSEARKGKWSDRQKAALTKVHESMRKQVICVDTGEVFCSITEAAKYVGCNEKGISAACSGIQISAKCLHWAYYTGQTHEELNSILADLLHKKEMVYKIRSVPRRRVHE